MRTATKVRLGISALAAGLFVGARAIKAYRQFLEEIHAAKCLPEDGAENLNVDYLSMHAEECPFPAYRHVAATASEPAWFFPGGERGMEAAKAFRKLRKADAYQKNDASWQGIHYE